jgi:integrase/recombinase XerC
MPEIGPSGLKRAEAATCLPLRYSTKNLNDAGVGLEQVAALAGHESLETTRCYCTPSRLDLERAVERIGEGE